MQTLTLPITTLTPTQPRKFGAWDNIYGIVIEGQNKPQLAF